MTHVVTLNAGSSSMKFGLFKLTEDDPIMVCTGAGRADWRTGTAC